MTNGPIGPIDSPEFVENVTKEQLEEAATLGVVIIGIADRHRSGHIIHPSQLNKSRNELSDELVKRIGHIVWSLRRVTLTLVDEGILMTKHPDQEPRIVAYELPE